MTEASNIHARRFTLEGGASAYIFFTPFEMNTAKQGQGFFSVGSWGPTTRRMIS